RRSVLRRESTARSASPANGNVAQPMMKSGNAFQTEFSDTASTSPIVPLRGEARREGAVDADTELVLDPLVKDSTYLKLKSQQYRLSFKPDYFTARLDNTVLFTQYQSAALNANSYSNPPLGGLLSMSLNDALENHKFTAGIRLPVNFSGMTYFLQYQNFTRRWDWGLLYLRTANYQTYNVGYVDSAGRLLDINEQLGKVTSHMVQGNVAYPLDRRRRIGMTMAVRQD